MNARRTILPSSRAQAGVTLIELMVSLLIGLLVTGGVLQIFAANRASYAFNQGLARLQENGRSVIDALNFNVRMAGYYGCLSETVMYNNLGNAGTLPFNMLEAIRGYEGKDSEPGKTVAPGTVNPANSADGGDWAPALPADIVGTAIPKSDVLVIRNVSSTSNTVISADATKIIARGAAASFVKGDIGVVSDCNKTSFFQITGVTNTTAGALVKFDLAHVAAGTPGNALPSWPQPDQEYAEGSQLLHGETWIYYIGARSVGGPPGLFQRRLQADGTSTAALVADELVEHAESMQILYGLDPGDDGVVDSYVTADNVANWERVVSVRISVVVRAPDEYGSEYDTRTYDLNGTTFNPIDDRRVRQVFSTTIAIRNRLP